MKFLSRKIFISLSLYTVVSANFVAAATTCSFGTEQKPTHHEEHNHAISPPPASIMGGHSHPKGEWMLSYRFMRMDMDGMRRGTQRLRTQEVFAESYTVSPESMTMEMHMLGIMYAPSNHLTLMLMTHYTEMSMAHRIVSPMVANMINGGSETFRTRTSGFGDTQLAAIYSVVEKKYQRTHVDLGLSFPTGSVNETDRLPGMGGPTDRVLPASMQLGSGTVDLLPSITSTHKHGDWTLGGHIRAQIRLEDENEEGYRQGHQVDVTGWLGKQLTPWSSLTTGLNYRNKGTLKGRQNNVSQAGPNGKSVTTAFSENYGGERIEWIGGLNLQPSFRFFNGHEFSIEVRLPLWEDVNGTQLETDSTLTIAWKKSF